VLLAMAAVLAVVAWQVAISWRGEPLRTTLTMERSLMPDLSFAEFVRTTERVTFGSTRSRRYTTDADPLDEAQAVGMLLRPDARPQFAWLVGQRPGFFLDVVEPVDRTLAVILAAATDEPQRITILFNGHELGSLGLRRDNEYGAVRVAVPADMQVPGRNRIQLDFARIQDQRVEGETAPLPIGARLRIVRFLLPEEEIALTKGKAEPETVRRAGLRTSEEGERRLSELILQGGTCVSVAARLPETERVALHLNLTRLDLPLELWATPDGEPTHLLVRVEVGSSGPGTVAADLSPWAGGYVRLNLRVTDGPGSVQLQGLALLVPGGPDDVVEDGTGDGTVDGAVDGTGAREEDRPFMGHMEVLRNGPLPLLSWTEGGLCLVVDVASRRRRLFDLEADAERTRDVSFTRPAATAWLYQELCRSVNGVEATADWAIALRMQLLRQ
jgi:hypothetical protein